jgi:hypothetical protein
MKFCGFSLALPSPLNDSTFDLFIIRFLGGGAAWTGVDGGATGVVMMVGAVENCSVCGAGM